MANRERGEIEIELGGETFTLRPSFDALVGLEDRLGIGLVPLARRFARIEFGLKDVWAVVDAGIRGAGATPPKDLGSRLVRVGFERLGAPLMTFLLGALAGDAKPGNASAVATPSPGDATASSDSA